VEIFSSVQGEGPHVGEATLFIRLGGCDLRCRWCDSPHTWQPRSRCRVECEPASGRFRELDNPVPIAVAVEAARALDLARHAFVSLTGGEPLLQPEAVAALAEALSGEGVRIHLETHGLAEAALAAVVDRIDVVSMDWKLGSDVRRASDARDGPEEAFHAQHVRFLTIARRAPECVVKVVVTPATRLEELDAMAEAIASVDAQTPLVVQPVTPFASVRDAPPARELLETFWRLRRRLPRTRLIPQTHAQIGVP
jgi:organic radical activating enzyme